MWSLRKVARVSWRSNGTVGEADMDDSPLLALEDRIRSIINLHASIIWTNFRKVDSKALLNMSAFSGESVGKEPDFLQSNGTDHVHNTVSFESWSFPGLQLNVRIASSDRFFEARVQGVLAVKGCREKFVCQDVHLSLSGVFASDVMSGSDTVSDRTEKDVDVDLCPLTRRRSRMR